MISQHTIIIPSIFLIIACIFDFKSRKIPNEVTYTMLLFGCLYLSVLGGLNGFVRSIIGMLTSCIILAFFSKTFSFGGGDKKLIMACGAWLGKDCLYFLFFTLLILIIYNIFLVIKKEGIGNLLSTLKLEFLYSHKEPLENVPGAFFIAAGYIVTMFLLGEPLCFTW